MHMQKDYAPLVHFIGAGPGAPDLITLRGLVLLQQCDCCLYAGSLVPQEILEHLPKHAIVENSADMVLNDIVALMIEWVSQGKKVVRLHSGDPSIYGAIFEQMRLLDLENIEYNIVPGVTAFTAAAAEMKRELTLPEISQSVVITRTSVRASDMPPQETLENFGRTGSTLAIHLSINNIARVVRDLIPYYGDDCPCVIAYRVGWPDQMYVKGVLSDIRGKVKQAKITRTALIFVGRVFDEHLDNVQASKLYDPKHSHVLRERRVS